MSEYDGTDNLVKTPLTQYGDRTQKIEYIGHKQSFGEWFTLFVFFGFLLLPSITPLVVFLMPNSNITISEKLNVGDVLIGYIPHLIAAVILFAIFMFFRKKRLKKLDEIKKIIKNGQMVIGDLMSLESVTHGSADDKTTDYFFRIKYKKPGLDNEIEFDTPFLEGHPQLRNKELPLKVKIYYLKDEKGEHVYADEIINPPIEKVKARKLIRSIMIVLIIVFALSGIFLAAVNLVLGFTLFAIAMILTVVTNFVIDRK